MKFALGIIASLAITLIASLALKAAPPENRDLYLADVRSYASCAVRNNRASARKLILDNVDNETMERKFGDLYIPEPVIFVPDCRELVLQARSIIIQPDALRSAIADLLVLKDFGENPAIDFAGLEPLTHLPAESDDAYRAKLNAAKFEKQRESIREKHGESVSRNWLSVYGECVVREDPLSAHALLMAKPGSVGERSTISTIQPTLGACLVEGESLTFDRHTLRATIAINYYRLAMAKQALSAGSSN